MKNDIKNWNEMQTDKERIISYDTDKAHIYVHIPIRTNEQQKAYEKKVKAALREFYFSVTKQGLDWDEITARKN